MLFIAEEYDITELDETSQQENSESQRTGGDNPSRVTHVSWGVFCGKNSPPPRMTEKPGSTLVIVFRSDNSEAKIGFHASFHTVVSVNIRFIKYGWSCAGRYRQNVLNSRLQINILG